MADDKTKVARTAKGKKPQYFSDPAIDKLLSITLTLAEELSVTRERLDAVERILQKEGVLKRESIEQFQANEEETAERAQARARFVERVLRAVQMQLEEATGEDMPHSEEDIIRHLS